MFGVAGCIVLVGSIALDTSYHNIDDPQNLMILNARTCRLVARLRDKSAHALNFLVCVVRRLIVRNARLRDIRLHCSRGSHCDPALLLLHWLRQQNKGAIFVHVDHVDPSHAPPALYI